MKITLEARKTTWVPFIDSTAKLDVEWKSRAEYNAYAIRKEHTWTVQTRYTFSGLQTDAPIPTSQLVLMEQGVPIVITSSVVSAVKNRFQSEEIEDPFVVITDKLARVTRSEPQRRQLARGLIERSWTETIARLVKIENKTGKQVSLELTVVDKPADELTFHSSQPEPSVSRPPEYVYQLELDVDAIHTLHLTFELAKRESIQAPVTRRNRADQLEDDVEFAQELVQGEFPEVSDSITESAVEE